MAPKATPDNEVEFLLCCLENIEGRIKWNEVAVRLGRFKNATTAQQFYKRMRAKYDGKIPVLDEAPPTTAKAGKGGKKRDAEGEDSAEEKAKRVRMSNAKHTHGESGDSEIADDKRASRTRQEKQTAVGSLANMPEYVSIAEEEAWNRAVKGAAGRSRGALFTSGYQGAAEPFQYFDATENQMKTFDPVTDDIDTL